MFTKSTGGGQRGYSKEFDLVTSESKTRSGFVATAYQKYGDALGRYFARRLHNPQDARELSQEVWMRLLRIGDTRELLQPLAYIYTTANHVLREFKLRQARGRVSFDTEASRDAAENPPHISSDELIDQVTSQSQLDQAFAGIPSMYRKILLMRLTDHLTFEEIGAQLGFSAQTSRRYFYRAMAQFRLKWTEGSRP